MDSPAQTGQDAREEIEISLDHAIPQKPFPQYIDATVFLEVKDLLGGHPDRHIRQWTENPRLYTLLRMLQYEEDGSVFKKFDKEQIGDFWLPLTSASLTQLAQSNDLDPAKFRRAQLHILSPSDQMSEEKLNASSHTHRYIREGGAYFEELEKIGRGGSAEVARVRHKLSGKQFACKRILRADTIKLQRNQLIEFEQEVGVLQRISHPHFVSFVASFTDLTSFSLILSPVAKDVLKSMLERQTKDQPLPLEDITTLRRSFGCLATAISFLHEQKVRHKDIKPGNILLSDGRVYLCDFGISRDWSKSENSTTEGDVLKFTRRYCAPEVFGRDPRNTKSDIWSLGCVFLEIISVIKGHSLEEMNNFLLNQSGSESAQGLWCALEAINAWLVKIRSEKNDSADDLPLDWIVPMIRMEPEERLKASEILEMIKRQTADVQRPDLFIGSCCGRSDSARPFDITESPNLTNPRFSSEGLGIQNASTPPRSPYLDLPVRHERANTNLSSEDRGRLRDGSVSPRTQSFQAPSSDTSDTIPFPMDPVSPLSSRMGHRFGSGRIDSAGGSHNSFSKPAIGFTNSPPQFHTPPIPPPPPAIYDVKCGCAGQPKEKHIFNAPLLSSTIEFELPTMKTCSVCEMREDRVQIYETLPEDPKAKAVSLPKMWWVTRRLVISYLSGSPEMRRCSSFWVPLADLRYSRDQSDVTLSWSDCNQMTERRAANYGQHYDWIYNPKDPNNRVVLRFQNLDQALAFIDTIRLPYEDNLKVRNGRKTPVSDSQELFTFEIGKQGGQEYRVASLSTTLGSYIDSRLYIQWPEVDLDIRVHDNAIGRFEGAHDYQMTVKINNVSTPTYYSDIRGEPAVDHTRTAYFEKALQLKTAYSATFPIGTRHSLPTPPLGVIDMLHNLTGWTLRYFAIVEKFKSKNKRFGSKKYGRADILLWEREVLDNSLKRRGTQLAFRLHEESDFLWTTGSITSSTTLSYTNTEVTLSVSHKSRGRLLNTTSMTAIPGETILTHNHNNKSTSHASIPPPTSSSSSSHQEDTSELVLTFQDERYRLEFDCIVAEFKAAAQVSAPLSFGAGFPALGRSFTGASKRDSGSGSGGSGSGAGSEIRRIGSLGSGYRELQMSPPMR